MRILLVDDDAELVDLLTDYLTREGFTVGSAYDGASGVKEALTAQYDIVVLDVMMPGITGIEALTRIRAASNIPVVMLTARGDDADRIIGLELGADDYVPKPCTPRELAARLRAILKRSGSAATASAPEKPIVAGELTVWSTQRRVECGNVPIELTSTEYNLLELLARHAGHPVPREKLSQEAIGRPLMRFDRSIDVHMSRIRQKLGPMSDGRPRIMAVFRKGYQLIAA